MRFKATLTVGKDVEIAFDDQPEVFAVDTIRAALSKMFPLGHILTWRGYELGKPTAIVERTKEAKRIGTVVVERA